MAETNFDYRIEKMQREDVKTVFEIEKKLLGTSNENTISNTLENQALNYYVLKMKNEIVGFIELSIIPPECELYDIAIKKEYQGKHLSNLLMNFMIELCKSNNVLTIFLEVNSINNNAINLYKKYGFEPFTLRKNYYGENDAILMKKDL